MNWVFQNTKDQIRVLKSDIFLRSAESVDMIWLVRCALHNIQLYYLSGRWTILVRNANVTEQWFGPALVRWCAKMLNVDGVPFPIGRASFPYKKIVCTAQLLMAKRNRRRTWTTYWWKSIQEQTSSELISQDAEEISRDKYVGIVRNKNNLSQKYFPGLLCWTLYVIFCFVVGFHSDQRERQSAKI